MVILPIYYDSTITKLMVTNNLNLLEHILLLQYHHITKKILYIFVSGSYVMVVPGSTPSSLS